jgi:hypothetical protein
MHIASTYSNGFDVAVTSEDLAAFAAKWPCFGTQTSPANWRGAALLLTFDRKGDLTDIQGDEGLDGLGVSALVDDAKQFAFEVYELADKP